MQTMRHSQKRQTAFTLIELLIVIAIIGILSAIAIPSYFIYTKKAAFTEVMNATAPIQFDVAICYNKNGNFANCASGGVGGVPASTNTIIGAVNNISVDSTGTITVTPNSYKGLNANDKFILEPHPSSNSMIWYRGGQGCLKYAGCNSSTPSAQ